MWDLVSWPDSKPRPPILGAENLSHWTTREVFIMHFLLLIFFCKYKTAHKTKSIKKNPTTTKKPKSSLCQLIIWHIETWKCQGSYNNLSLQPWLASDIYKSRVSSVPGTALGRKHRGMAGQSSGMITSAPRPPGWPSHLLWVLSLLCDRSHGTLGAEHPIRKHPRPFSKPAGWLCIAPLLPHKTPLWLRFSGKESACNAGDPGSIPRLGRSPGDGNDNPLQYSCLENPMYGQRSLVDSSTWGHKESDPTEWLTLSISLSLLPQEDIFFHLLWRFPGMLLVRVLLEQGTSQRSAEESCPWQLNIGTIRVLHL